MFARIATRERQFLFSCRGRRVVQTTRKEEYSEKLLREELRLGDFGRRALRVLLRYVANAHQQRIHGIA
jgi:hypothetical protein